GARQRHDDQRRRKSLRREGGHDTRGSGAWPPPGHYLQPVGPDHEAHRRRGHEPGRHEPRQHRIR
uniref:Uncharacterized protein n=1 Tax=Aegilops tauschii subsp. strangulata TaxID=200361 RepID=A0A453IDJ1_AEGTS